ncbi:MAG: PAS domain S-box protein [Rhizobiales bacterium]|nr:PAS domain S-box protein [Hyphomicrobiales bacterium]
MAESLFPFADLRDTRLAGHATGAVPAWLWRPDGRLILWTNAPGADLFGASSPAGLASRRLDGHPAADQIAHLAETLPLNGSPRLAALEWVVDGCERRPMCLCSRLTLADSTPAILAVATEPGGPAMPLDERVRRLLADTDAPVAAFAPDGSLMHATAAADDAMGDLTTLASLGAGALGQEALAKGHAEGRTPLGVLSLDRIGRDGAVMLLTTFSEAPAEPGTPGPKLNKPSCQPSAPVEASDVTPAAAPAAPPSATPEKPAERRPLRFVWQMDQDGRFTVASDAFAALVGPESAAVLGQPWIDIAAKLKLDPDEHVSRAVDSRETWSGITVMWPVAGTDERLTVELSGLPTFDRERTYLGYRGFGVCRDVARVMAPDHPDSKPAVGGITRPSEAAPSPEGTQPQNIVPLRSTPVAEAKTPALSPVERTAFSELARQLNARLKGDQPDAASSPPTELRDTDARAEEPAPAMEAPPAAAADDLSPEPVRASGSARELMDRLPVGVLVYQINTPIYANRAFLKWSGEASLEAFTASGGLDRLFVESGVTEIRDDARSLTLTTGAGSGLGESRLFSIIWEGERAHALAIVPAGSEQTTDGVDVRRARRQICELRSIVDLATDGVAIIDGAGNIIRLSHGAQALFGCESKAIEGQPFTELLASDGQAAAADDFDALAGDADAHHAGREVNGRAHGAGSIALHMTLGRIAADKPTFCAVFRDISLWKRAEEDLLSAKHQAEQASRTKSDFLAKISHEIRTPLNAIIGFSEVMMEERLGSIDNERYRAYVKDIHASGEHLVSLLNDLLDLSKIEAGKLELTFSNVNLNELTQQCVALMQPLANRGRVIIRTSLAAGLPAIVSDARSVRQILLNLLSNSIKFTAAGGQVIVSTALTERGEAVLRVRDTGIGMSEKEIETALEPFRQIETSARGGSGGTGLGLPLTKALAEANRANFAIKSNVNSGTLVEVAFPTTRAPGR